jgi:quercetin dioxygenase-like cupin family protein
MDAMDAPLDTPKHAPNARETDRRSALRRVVGVSAAALALPLFERGQLGLIGTAEAEGYAGVPANMGDLVDIAGSSVPEVPIAEWDDPKFVIGPNRIVEGKDLVDKAPADASRYTVKTFDFPSGSIRVLTFKKGQRLHHQVTFETEIFVLQGSATLNPLRGLAGKPVKIGTGDALYLPSGTLTNPKCTEDTILVTFIVANAAKDPKGTIIHGKDVKETHRVEWQKDGKDMSSDKPEDMKKAGPGAVHLFTKRYVFDGNSIRYATLKKGGRTGTVTNNRVDVLIYMVKGRMRRKEGDKMLELAAGDATREKIGHAGYWEVTEDSIFLATDAPMKIVGTAPV